MSSSDHASRARAHPARAANGSIAGDVVEDVSGDHDVRRLDLGGRVGPRARHAARLDPRRRGVREERRRACRPARRSPRWTRRGPPAAATWRRRRRRCRSRCRLRAAPRARGGWWASARDPAPPHPAGGSTRSRTPTATRARSRGSPRGWPRPPAARASDPPRSCVRTAIEVAPDLRVVLAQQRRRRPGRRRHAIEPDRARPPVGAARARGRRSARSAPRRRRDANTSSIAMIGEHGTPASSSSVEPLPHRASRERVLEQRDQLVAMHHASLVRGEPRIVGPVRVLHDLTRPGEQAVVARGEDERPVARVERPGTARCSGAAVPIRSGTTPPIR